MGRCFVTPGLLHSNITAVCAIWVPNWAIYQIILEWDFYSIPFYKPVISLSNQDRPVFYNMPNI